MSSEYRINTQSLPVSFRYLLEKPDHFTVKATTRALQSWLQRIRIGLQKAKDGNLRSTSDIRNWFTQKTVSHNDTPIISPPAEQEIIFELKPCYTNHHKSEHMQTTIYTVPHLPYVPHQQNSTTNLSTLNPTFPLTYELYRDI